MEILSVPDQSWEQKITCWYCSTVYLANQDDFDYDSWKISGYHFNDTAVCVMKLYVKCPSCDKLTQIDENKVPILLMDSLRKAYKS